MSQIRIRMWLVAFAAAVVMQLTGSAQADCKTGSALDNYARSWFVAYEAGFGLTLNCADLCSNDGNGNKILFECATGSNPVYWRGTSSGCGGSSPKIYAIWTKPTTWEYSGAYFTCVCSGGNTSCHWGP